MRQALVVLVLAVAIGGCRLTNGWSILAAGPEEESTASDTPSVDGIWTGTLDLADGGTHDNVIAAVWDGEMLAVSQDGDAAYAGAAAPPTTAAVAATAAGTDLAEDEARAYDAAGAAQGTGTLTGTATEAESLTVTIADTSRDGQLDLAYDELFERGTGLSQLDASWSRSWTEDGQTQTLTLTVSGTPSDSSHSIEGSDTTGCQYAGEVAVLDVDRNLYRTELTIEACGEENGDYAGLSWLDPDAEPQEWVALAERAGDAETDSRFWWGRLEEQ